MSAIAQFRQIGLMLMILSICCVSVRAEDFPSKPITIVVAFGIGGASDRMSRTMSTYLAEELGQPVVVINKKGAGTLLGANYVLGQAHDGYTILATSFSPNLAATIITGAADYSVDDFAYINCQWFDEVLVAVHKDSKYRDLEQLLESVRLKPKTVRAAVGQGSASHLTVNLLLEAAGIPPDNLNLVTYSSGGQARAAAAGGIVDFIITSATAAESIREYLRPLAIGSGRFSDEWNVPPLNDVLASIDVSLPLLPGAIRGFATSVEFRRDYPERFEVLASAFQRALDDARLQTLLDEMEIGRRWLGPERSEKVVKKMFAVYEGYSHLLRN